MNKDENPGGALKGTKKSGEGENPAQPAPLSEQDLAALANQVAKALTAKQLKTIGGSIAKSFKPKDFWNIGKSLANSPAFWIVAGLGVISVCVTAWKAVPHFIKEKAETVFNQEITNQIKLQFREPRISNMVGAVAASEAANLLDRAVSPAINKFEAVLAQRLTEIPTNLFSRTCNESFDGQDTNVTVLNLGTNENMVLLRLQTVPVQNSVQCMASALFMQGTFRNIKMEQRKNVAYTRITGDIHPRSLHYEVQYVKDILNTNLIKGMEIRGKEIFIDGTRVPL